MKTLKFRNVKIKQTEICLLIGLITAIIFCFFNLIGETSSLSKKMIRLHIIANSNSEVDQNLKINLKNAILENFNFDEYENDLNLAREQISKNLSKIENFSQNFVKNEGFDYPVKAKLEQTNFNTRCYENFSLPAATYEALKIEIGKAKGRNWWCVFVPAMCVPAAKAKQKIKNVLNNNQTNLIEKGSKTEIRFASIELYEKIKTGFKKFTKNEHLQN